jgi:hypothetical protein
MNQPPRRFENPRGAVKALVPELREAIKTCAAQQLTARQTASKLGLKYHTVWKAASRMGITFRRDPAIGQNFSRTETPAITRRPPGVPNYAGIAAALRW